MSGLRQFVLGLHLLSAVVWIGGMAFIGLAIGPYLRTLEPVQRARLVNEIGGRFRTVSWIAIAILIATGIGNLALWGVLGDLSAFLTTRTGRILIWKLLVVAIMVIIAALHDFVLGPRATADPDSHRMRKLVSWLGRLNLILGLLILYLAIRLRG
ncbi:MAG: DUF4149 domain-containing protein [Anaerolineae bacterium]